MDRKHGKEGESLPPTEAEAAALDFCARAANVDLWIHANLGDTREDVELDCRILFAPSGMVLSSGCFMVPHLPGFMGRPGWVRSSAWIWLFSSIESTTAWSGGLT